jgi:hypothetical protein
MAQRDKDAAKSAGLEARTHRVSGSVSILEAYRLEEAKARLGWSDSALRAAKRRGLKLIACGRRRYVTGKEIVRFLESLQSETHTPPHSHDGQ